MDFRLAPEEKLILETVRGFVEAELMPLEAELQEAEIAGRGGDFPTWDHTRALQAKARELGLWGLQTPEEYGGLALGARMTALATMELFRCFVPFAFGGQADNILFEGTEEQKREYLVPTLEGERRSCFALTEPTAGSDAGAIRMTAVRDGADYVLTGEKVFITGGNDADFAITFAVTDPQRRARGGITAFLVDRGMGFTSRPIPTMGSWGPARLSFQGVRVPARNVLGEVGRGFELALRWIVNGRVIIPARAVGRAQRLLELGVAYARQRSAFGRPIGDYQAIQWMLADSEVELQATRWLSLHAASLQDEGRDARHEASIAKLQGAQMVGRVADRVLQIHGGMGYTKELPVERVYRDVRVFRIYEGTDEIQRRTIARGLLRGTAGLGRWD